MWDIHYHAVGEQITDTVELGLYFYPKGEEPRHRQVLASFSGIQGGNRNLDIPPNSLVVTENFHVMKQNGRIENFQPHLHLRGKGMQMEAILPDGTRQVLSLVSDYDFNWHNNYVYADDVAPLLPKGTVLLFKTWYDNTASKKGNPDPNQWIGWGDRTVDEMGHAWVNVTYLNDEDFKAEVEKRKAADVEARPADNSSSAGEGGTRCDPIDVFVARRRLCGRDDDRSGCIGADAADGSHQGLGTGGLSRLRGLVQEPGRQLHDAVRVLQPQFEAGAGRGGRPEQQDRAVRARRRPADALRSEARVGRVHRQGAEGLRHEEGRVDA